MKFNNETLRTAVKEWLEDQTKAEVKYGHISNWDVSNVTDMSNMFKEATSFNQPIGNWDVSKVTDMSGMFEGSYDSPQIFNQPIGDWNVSKVTNMERMFRFAKSFNHSLNDWDVSKVTNMEGMFWIAESFNQPIGDWDVSKVTNMDTMFYMARSFNQSIGDWDVSKVTNMNSMFYMVLSFNQPIGDWNVSNVTDMSYMFDYAISFNQPLNSWDVSSVTGMRSMFNKAESFNQPLNSWDVSSVKDMSRMFDGATSFNLDNQPHKISDPLTQSKPVEVNEIESNIDGKIWIAMEKSEFLDIDDNTFEALELTIQFSDEGDGEHEVTETIKKEMNYINLVFTEYQDDSGEFKLQKVINCPEIQDTDNYGDAGHHGPFSTTDEVVDYLKKLKTINFDELDLYIDSTD